MYVRAFDVSLSQFKSNLFKTSKQNILTFVSCNTNHFTSNHDIKNKFSSQCGDSSIQNGVIQTDIVFNEEKHGDEGR